MWLPEPMSATTILAWAYTVAETTVSTKARQSNRLAVRFRNPGCLVLEVLEIRSLGGAVHQVWHNVGFESENSLFLLDDRGGV